MQRIIIQLEDELRESLDRAARLDRVSRSEEARRAISWALAERLRRRELEAVVRSYADEPPEDLIAPVARITAAWPH